MNKIAHVILKQNEEVEVQQGFPYVYDNEIDCIKYKNDAGKNLTQSLKEADIQNGSVVEVFARAGAFLGTGIINKASKITIRFIGFEHADKIMQDTKLYWSKIINNAINIRNLNFSVNESCRLVFAESDFVPGLIVERYVSKGKVYLLVQFLALACEVFRDEILSALISCCKPTAIYERSEGALRIKEGLEERCSWIFSKGEDVFPIVENDIILEIDIAHGQKTGYFLDQKRNREYIRKFCKGKRVLDAFCNLGAFGLNAKKAGAKEVISVDISEDAIKSVERNISLNNMTNISVVCEDVFDLLKKYEAAKQKFDVIILDPPAFTKSAKQIQKAYGGYKEINLRAMRLIHKGGILITCSCSYYFDSNTFYSMIMHAARDSHRRVQILEKRGASPDHPVLLGYPQSEYLKCAICRVI